MRFCYTNTSSLFSVDTPRTLSLTISSFENPTWSKRRRTNTITNGIESMKEMTVHCWTVVTHSDNDAPRYDNGLYGSTPRFAHLRCPFISNRTRKGIEGLNTLRWFVSTCLCECSERVESVDEPPENDVAVVELRCRSWTSRNENLRRIILALKCTDTRVFVLGNCQRDCSGSHVTQGKGLGSNGFALHGHRIRCHTFADVSSGLESKPSGAFTSPIRRVPCFPIERY